MELEVDFQEDRANHRAVARIVMYGAYETVGGSPCLTSECESMGALETEIRSLEEQLQRLRQWAKAKFAAAGISN
jgi:hypothetical protein